MTTIRITSQGVLLEKNMDTKVWSAPFYCVTPSKVFAEVLKKALSCKAAGLTRSSTSRKVIDSVNRQETFERNSHRRKWSK